MKVLGGTPCNITLSGGARFSRPQDLGSITDYDPFEGRVSASQWLRRGLGEELNLTSAFLDERMKRFSFDDVFLVTGLFEIGIVATVEISGTSFEELCSRADQAKDRKLEVNDLVCVPATAKEVRRFLAGHDMIPHGRYAFARVAARQGVSLGDRWWAEPNPSRRRGIR